MTVSLRYMAVNFRTSNHQVVLIMNDNPPFWPPPSHYRANCIFRKHHLRTGKNVKL